MAPGTLPRQSVTGISSRWKRLGGLSPARLREDPAAVRAAVQRQPKLHRFVSVVPDWLVQAAGIVLGSYEGNAERLWSDQPTAVELRRRLEA